ncbi:MAG: 2-oxoglutarate dehydrogenase complex dihydrolipoyllysine-residue succinyltransferase [Alphaproteobacteria bacterium]|nr:2-oxoglutarate dehydrogenase complex dihydrolipoyllysine-residue succinyltransferase [Alphaproteobacteria bacterium]
MAIDIRVPALGESVTEATVAKWLKKPGEAVAVDEPLVELETDKVTVEVPAPSAGVLSEIRVQAGATTAVGSVLGTIGEGAGAAAAPPRPQPAARSGNGRAASSAPQPTSRSQGLQQPSLSPAARKIAEEYNLLQSAIQGSGRDGRVTKGDVLSAIEARGAEPSRPSYSPPPAAPLQLTPQQIQPEQPRQAPQPQPQQAVVPQPRESAPPMEMPRPPVYTPGRSHATREERVPMTRLRKTIALRLKEAQNTAAMLTTFNEADMTAIMGLRTKHKDAFEKRYGVRLGFMSFFVKACVMALKEIPSVNAEIEGEEIVYKNYYDIGVAVGTDRGLVVPVLRDADQISFADIERAINDFGARARENKIKLEELQGGTFTVSNGGVYGSLMSTPILNVPQSGILGMHKIQQRPIVVDGKVEIRPMMYLALSYDHRLVDGREAVTFLVRVKEFLEAPERMILEL